mmetsp:Transcript_73810/g.175708  ORF Transcript_73810/g.175708 Transcript_73810/m.175708 type:complete len:172 (+) Transcript_73810:59-574(+)
MTANFAWRTSNSDYGWQHGGDSERRSRSCGSLTANDVQKDISISEVLARRSTVKRPVTAPPADTQRYPQLAAREEKLRLRRAEPVSYADIWPSRFGAKDGSLSYPSRCSDHPLYRTESMKVGGRVPEPHHLEEIWFPGRQTFTKGFTDPAPRYTGIDTALERSRVHQRLEA